LLLLIDICQLEGKMSDANAYEALLTKRLQGNESVSRADEASLGEGILSTPEQSPRPQPEPSSASLLRNRKPISSNSPIAPEIADAASNLSRIPTRDLQSPDEERLSIDARAERSLEINEDLHPLRGAGLGIVKGHIDTIWDVAVSPYSTTVASASRNNTIKLWNSTDGRGLKTLRGHTGAVFVAKFLIDGFTLASGSYDKTVRLRDSRSGLLWKMLTGHSGGIYALAVSPDGIGFASPSKDRTVRLWDVRSEESLKILKGHRDCVDTVAFSPDGATLASGSDDQNIRLWDSRSGECLKKLRGHTKSVWVVIFPRTVIRWRPRTTKP
jgi:predicted NACHT family NTPase